MKKFDCEDCKYRTNCENEYGKKRSDGDDYRAICGTHFCRRSWDSFYKMMKTKNRKECC